MLSVPQLFVRAGVGVLSAAAAACSDLQYFLANAPTVFGAYDRHSNVPYGDGPRRQLDIYSPRQAKNRPVVIFWYGGTWLNGRKADYRFVGATLAQRGFVTVLPDYRLYPSAKFPLFLEDAAQAVAWVQAHAAQFGGDPQRIVLMGHSAGAHMAAFLAYNCAFLAKAGARPEYIKGLIGLSGPYVLTPNSDVLHAIFASPYSLADWQPIRFVTNHSPPTLLFHGTRDDRVEVAHSEQLRDALLKQQVFVDAEILPKRSHADTVAALAFGARYRAPVLERSVEFIERVTAVGAAQRVVAPSAGSVSPLSAAPSLGRPVPAQQIDPSP